MTENKVAYHTTAFKSCGNCIHFPVCRIRYYVIIAGVTLVADQTGEVVEQVQRDIAEHCKYFQTGHLDSARENIRALLPLIGDEGVCKACGARIFWVMHKNGKEAPYTQDGLNHFIDCPEANRFKK